MKKHKNSSSTASEPENYSVLFLLEVVNLTPYSVRKNIAFPLKKKVTGEISVSYVSQYSLSKRLFPLHQFLVLQQGGEVCTRTQ